MPAVQSNKVYPSRHAHRRRIRSRAARDKPYSLVALWGKARMKVFATLVLLFTSLQAQGAASCQTDCNSHCKGKLVFEPCKLACELEKPAACLGFEFDLSAIARAYVDLQTGGAATSAWMAEKGLNESGVLGQLDYLRSQQESDWRLQLPYFSVHYYYKTHPDLQQSPEVGANDHELKVHWIRHGLGEGRQSSPVFDVKYYLTTNPDLVQAFGPTNFPEALQHWRRHGIDEGRQSHPNFGVKCYLARYPDLQKAFGSANFSAAFNHYLVSGISEGRNGSCP